MLQKTTLEERSQKHWPSKIAQGLRFRMVWLALLVVLAVLAIPTFLGGTSWQAHANTPVPAHVSMLGSSGSGSSYCYPSPVTHYSCAS
jgi:hypothetical protein